MEAMLKKLVDDLSQQDGGGSFAVQRNEDAGVPVWMVSYEFGKEAEDSDMVGGAAYGVGDTPEEALRQVLEQCRLDTETVELPEGE